MLLKIGPTSITGKARAAPVPPFAEAPPAATLHVSPTLEEAQRSLATSIEFYPASVSPPLVISFGSVPKRETLHPCLA